MPPAKEVNLFHNSNIWKLKKIALDNFLEILDFFLKTQELLSNTGRPIRNSKMLWKMLVQGSRLKVKPSMNQPSLVPIKRHAPINSHASRQ